MFIDKRMDLLTGKHYDNDIVPMAIWYNVRGTLGDVFSGWLNGEVFKYDGMALDNPVDLLDDIVQYIQMYIISGYVDSGVITIVNEYTGEAVRVHLPT